MANTPVYSLPYPTNNDGPYGPAQIQALAEATEAELARVDSTVGALAALFDGPYEYIPELVATETNPNLGSGAVQRGGWYRHGGMIHVWVVLRFGSLFVNPGSGFYRVMLPVPAHPSYASSGTVGVGPQVGVATLRRNSPFEAVVGVVQLTGEDRVQVNVSSTIGTVTDAHPWQWSISDAISLTASYMAAD